MIWAGRILLFISFIMLVCGITYGQSQLYRISIAERTSDPQYVIRFHLSSKSDSVLVVQSSARLTQLGLFGTVSDSSSLHLFDSFDHTFFEIHVKQIDFGVGINIVPKEDHYFTVQSYYDRNQKDLLVAFSLVDLQVVELLVDGIIPIDWTEYQNSSDTLLSLNEAYFSRKSHLELDVVVLDAGHGGHDPGALHGGIKEKDIVLSITKKVGAYLNQYLPEVKVIYTREDDRYVDLKERGHIANESKADIFVSIHCNATSNRLVKGTEVYFLGANRADYALEVTKRENTVIQGTGGVNSPQLSDNDLLLYELENHAYIAESEQLAIHMEKQFSERAQRPQRPPKGIKQAGFVVLYYSSMPSVLLELGFLSNKQERKYLTSSYGQTILSSAIFRAIRDYKVEFDKRHRTIISK